MPNTQQSKSVAVVRKANLGDIPQMREIYDQSAVTRYVSARNDQEISGIIAGTASAFFLACSDTRTVTGLALVNGLTNVNRSAEICQLAALQQGAGVGPALMHWLLQYLLCTEGFNRVWLDVFPENSRARRLYGKLGFVEEGLMREAYRMDGGYRSAILMSVLRSDYKPSCPTVIDETSSSLTD